MRRTQPDSLTIEELTGLNTKSLNFVIEYVKDFSARRAAEASGYDPDYGAKLLKQENVQAALNHILAMRLDSSQITAEWLLQEAVDNHLIARQRGNLAASNASLNLIAKHVSVDALAANKHEVDVSSSKEVAERLMRWRKRTATPPPNDDVSFL